MAKVKAPASYNDREFIFCDLLGNELKEGDSAIMARVFRSSAVLRLIIIGRVEKFDKIVKQHYQVIGKRDNTDRETYFNLGYSQSGTRFEQVMGLKGVEFEIDKPEFARLFVKQADFRAANPEQEESS